MQMTSMSSSPPDESDWDETASSPSVYLGLLVARNVESLRLEVSILVGALGLLNVGLIGHPASNFVAHAVEVRAVPILSQLIPAQLRILSHKRKMQVT